MRKFLCLSVCFLAAFLLTSNAGAIPVYEQDFSNNTDGWLSYQSSVTRIDSGAYGSDYALIGNDGASFNGAFTRFGGYSSTWEGGFNATIDFFLDPSWALGSGFDYSVAASDSDGNHHRDYIFHVAKDTSSDSLLVGGSNNTNFSTREDLENINNFAINSAGWYTFKHVFYENSGKLDVNLNLLDANGNLLFSETRHGDPIGDDIGSIGGNRYGWITFLEPENGIGIDNVKLSTNNPVPEPSTMILLSFGILGFTGLMRKKSHN